MDRREALRTTGFVVGYSLSASAIAAVLHSCKPEGTAADTKTEAKDDWQPEFFEPEQLVLVGAICDTILPETETPGATAVQVDRYIDDEVMYLYTPQQQYDFVMGLEDVAARAQSVYSKPFHECTAEQRTELLKKLEIEERAAEEAGKIYGKPFFKTIKGMTFSGYFSSQKIAEEVLNYDPIPTAYEGCIDADAGTMLWSI